MSQQEYFLSKYCVPFGRAIRSSFGFQALLAGLLLCAANAAQAESALPSGNDSKAQSGTAESRQLAVLIDEDPFNPYYGERYSGNVVWRTETIRKTGEKPDIAIGADIEIPERNLKMAVSLRRNTDRSLPASHTIEVSFAFPPNFSGGGVDDVLGITMKPSEQAQGEPLAAEAVKVSEGFFLVGLSNSGGDQANNMQLLNEPWLDVLLVYKNHRKAILAIEKGAFGREVFEKAFTAWKVQ